MPFRNSILANEELLREAIRSRNWVGGLSGWRIARNGDAEFTNLLTRGTVTAGDVFSNHVSLGADNTLYPGKSFIFFKTGHADESFQGVIQTASGTDMDIPAGALAALGIALDQPIMLYTPPQFTSPAYFFLEDPAPASGLLFAGRDNSEADESVGILAADRLTFITSEGSRDVLDPVDAALPLAANVGAFGGAYSTPTYYVDNWAKTCTVTCMVTRTVASAAIAVHAIGTLPVGARPPREFVFTVIGDVGGAGERERRLNIATTGAINLVCLPAVVWGIGQYCGFTITFPII